MKAFSSRALLACLLAATAALPGVAAAGEECRAVSDALRDHGGPTGISMPGADPRAGDAADLTGFAIYPAGWGDLIVQVGVADVDAPLHPLADADRYAVSWDYEARRFTLEALRTELGWSYAAWARSIGVSLDPDAITDTTYQVVGSIDPDVDTITFVLSALALEGPGGPRTLHEVHVTAEEIRRVGVESATGGGHATAAFADRSPDTATGTTTIDLDVACRPTTWAGATPMCRMVDDPAGDVAPTAAALAGDGSRSLDLTGLFVASTAGDLVLEIGVDSLIGASDSSGAAYGMSFDIDGRTLVAEASRTGVDWRYEARYEGELPASIPVAGSVSADRIRFEIPADLVRPAFTGRPMRAFSAWSSALLDPPGIGLAADRAPDDGPDPSGYTLGGPCTGI